MENGKVAVLESGGKVAAIIPRTVEEVYRLSQYIVASGWAPRDVKTPESATVCIMHGMEVGVPPMAALQGIANINGRPCIWGDLALAIVTASGLLEDFDEGVKGEGDERHGFCKVRRRGRKTPGTRTFSVADAKKAGLWNKPGPWTNYPDRMLKMRARAWALRDMFADVLKGLHIREEVEDIPEPRDITPDPLETPPPPRQVKLVTVEEAEAEEIAEAYEAAGGTMPPERLPYPELPAVLDRRPKPVEGDMETIAAAVREQTAKLNEDEDEEAPAEGGLSDEEFESMIARGNV